MKRAEFFRQRLQHLLGRSVRGGLVDKHRSEGPDTGSEFAGDVAGCVVVILDDLISTGGTMRRAAEACRARDAAAVYLAATYGLFTSDAEATLIGAPVDGIMVRCLAVITQGNPGALAGRVRRRCGIGERGRHSLASDGSTGRTGLRKPTDRTPTSTCSVRIGEHRLEGDLRVPAGANGLVIFAHGSGSSRLSPRNTRVAEALNAHGMATLMFDLLAASEAGDRRNVFDIPLLAALGRGALVGAR